MPPPDLRRARADLLAFSEIVGHPLTAVQAGALALEHRTTVIVAPRQSGKSRSLAVLALWWAFRRREQRVLIVSAGDHAARRLLSEAAAVAQRSQLLSGSVVDETAGLLALTNSSEIRSVPASERQVRGWTVDLLLVDEAALVEDDLLLSAAIPTTAARPDARIVLAGTPAGPEGAFYTFAEAGEEGSESVATFRWQLSEASWITEAVIDAARGALAPAAFGREFKAEFADVGSDERVIERAWIEAAQARTLDADSEPGDPGAIGVDLARHGGDESVAIKVRGGVVSVLFAVREPDLMQTTGRIAALGDRAALWLDVTGLGYGVADRLSEQGLAVAHFVAAARSSDPRRWINLRSEAWWNLREAFRDGLVDLPDDPVLAGQLASVRYGLASTGAVQIASKDSMRVSPDRADALVIALWGARGTASWAAWERANPHRHIMQEHPLARDAELRKPGEDLVSDLLTRKW